MQHNLINLQQTAPQSRKVIALTDNGKQVPFETLQEIYEAYLIFLRRCEEYFLCTYAPPEDVYSVGAHIKLEVDIYLKSISNKEEKNLREMIINCLLKRETCISGCHSMDEIGIKLLRYNYCLLLYSENCSNCFFLYKPIPRYKPPFLRYKSS